MLIYQIYKKYRLKIQVIRIRKIISKTYFQQRTNTRIYNYKECIIFITILKSDNQVVKWASHPQIKAYK